MAALLNHASLGKIQGKSSSGVSQYLGIKYGTLEDRFAEATMADSTGSIDAIRLGSVTTYKLLSYRDQIH